MSFVELTNHEIHSPLIDTVSWRTNGGPIIRVALNEQHNLSASGSRHYKPMENRLMDKQSDGFCYLTPENGVVLAKKSSKLVRCSDNLVGMILLHNL